MPEQLWVPPGARPIVAQERTDAAGQEPPKIRWQQIKPPPQLAEIFAAMATEGARGLACFVAPGYTVLRGREPGPSGLRWHLSVTRDGEGYPPWDVLASARYALCPLDVTMVMILPPPDQYVNVHNGCFHLHEAG